MLLMIEPPLYDYAEIWGEKTKNQPSLLCQRAAAAAAKAKYVFQWWERNAKGEI